MRKTSDKLQVLMTYLKGRMNLKSLVITLSAIVVFVTTYVLVLPAFTLDKDEVTQRQGRRR